HLAHGKPCTLARLQCDGAPVIALRGRIDVDIDQHRREQNFSPVLKLMILEWGGLEEVTVTPKPGSWPWRSFTFTSITAALSIITVRVRPGSIRMSSLAIVPPTRGRTILYSPGASAIEEPAWTSAATFPSAPIIRAAF